MRSLARLQRWGLLRLLPLPRLVAEGPPDPKAVEAVLSEILGPIDAVVVRLGRRRFNRALVLMPFDAEGRWRAVVKVARGESARRVLRLEHLSLLRAREAKVEGLQVPQPMAQLEVDDLSYLLMSPLTSSEVSRPEPVPVRQMTALADTGRRTVLPLRDTAAVERLGQQISKLDDPAQHAWTSAALQDLVTQLGEVAVPQGAWHGDWVPWNMAREGDEVLLWDWEHFHTEGLYGWDHVHYLAQHLRTSYGTTAAVEDDWLDRAHQALSRDWHLDELQSAAVVRTYLLEINVRYLNDRQEDPLGTPSRVGWARELVERLGHPGTAGQAGDGGRATRDAGSDS